MKETKPNFDTLDLQKQLDDDVEFFVNFVHKRLEGEEFIWSVFNRRIKDELLKCYRLEYLLLIINVPPRLGKTKLVRYFMAWTMRKYGRTYNNYYTYSDMLVNQTYTNMSNIFKIPEIAEGLNSAPFKRTKEDLSNNTGGGLYAQTTFGQVTGFGAGAKDDTRFTGAIFIDDAHKAQDTLIRIASANKAIKSAVLNRKNNHKVPIIVIGQRVSKYDITNFLMIHFKEWFDNGTAKLLKIPVEINGKTISSKEYPLEAIALEKMNDPDYYWTQLMQEPQNIEGKFFKDKHFESITDILTLKTEIIISFNPDEATEPIVLIAFRKDGKDVVIVDYIEKSIEADDFFTSIGEFAKENNARKVHIPSALVTKTVMQELKPLKVEEVEESSNVPLSAFYAVGLLKDNKIQIKDDEIYEAFKEELKLYPFSKRDFVTKAMISILEILFVKGSGRLSSSI